MRESVQAVLALIMIVALVATGAFWLDIKPNNTTWALRIICPVISLIILVILIYMKRKKDLVPDFLLRNCGNSFERNGLHFHVSPEFGEKGDFCFLIYFQNKYEKPCEVHIGLRPRKPTNVERIQVDFTCEPAAFGVVHAPVVFDLFARGKESIYEIGATVRYPKGKGKQLRFRSGKKVEMNARLNNTFFRFFQFFFLPFGLALWRSFTTITFQIPQHVDPHASTDNNIYIETLWKLSNPLDKMM